MIHLYALTASPVDLEGLAGVDDRPLRPVACPPLYGVVSDHDRAPGATRERALAHAGVVAATGERVATVPVQYGAQHADEAALRAAVAERAEPLQHMLRRVGGNVEVVVRFQARPSAPARPTPADPGLDGSSSDGGSRPPGPTVDAAGRGRAYLEGRLEREQHEQARRLAASQRLRERTAPVESLAVEATDRPGPRGPERCLLVPQEQVTELLAAVHALTEKDADLVVGGPWPPYTFAAEAGDG